MIPAHPLRKYNDNEGSEEGLPKAGVKFFKVPKSIRSHEHFVYHRRKTKANRKYP